ncbi:hypothetical protein [Jiella mangrovi]|uniref:Phosphatase PAP2 family protein n=1 Tax=Jiella mangrovi TaxID=2821407 RepID=A0ABS4BI20_9HYPH|nr:hypothetical protein [Jiella mangrovi]MBP0616408.1 hypothetical protein [Jiella mangrovi]
MFVAAINNADSAGDAYPFDVPIGPKDAEMSHRPKYYTETVSPTKFSFRKVINGETADVKVRNWESPRAGHVYDLEGPDAAALAISSFPKLGTSELIAEMGELYAMAYLRDVPVIHFEETAPADAKVKKALAALNKLKWFNSKPAGLSDEEARRHLARFVDPGQAAPTSYALDTKNLFRGSAPGAKDGPFVSQFLLIGNKGRAAPTPGTTDSRIANNPAPVCVMKVGADGKCDYGHAEIEDGYILWGVQTINQRLSVHEEGLNYLGDWASWLDAQNGADFRELDKYWQNGKPRFITTLRDLATYVHFDALYQAYLNAYLLLTGFKADLDVGLPSGGFHPTRGSFATFGPPHFQTLLTEVSSRALKAARRQKFQWQLRARPEYLAAMLSLSASTKASDLGSAQEDAKKTYDALDKAGIFGLKIDSKLPGWLKLPNGVTPPSGPDVQKLLPQAFPEGSPMHPSYAAGHATVAGACVTILKAVFQTYADPRKGNQTDPLASGYVPPDFHDARWWKDKLTLDKIGAKEKQLQSIYRPPSDAKTDKLHATKIDKDNNLTLIGELNKLAANISIARNIAGVHYYIDYYASLRLGERVAVGILEEQLLTYPEPVSMRFESFDGDRIVLEGNGDGVTIERHAYDGAHTTIDYDEWWRRHFVD